MTFKFECPYCGQRISTTTEDADTIGVCPACRNEVKVPLPPLPPVESAAVVSEPKRRGELKLAIFALVLCAMPWLCFTLWRSGIGKIPLIELVALAGALSGAGAVLCVVGVVVGHLAWRRAMGQRSARVVSILSLMLGYFSMLVMALVVTGLVTGSTVLYKQYKEPPDFTASDEPPDFMPAKMPVKAPTSTPPRAPNKSAEH